MNTLKIETNVIEEAIKQINSFRLQNKNKWYQIDLNFNGFNFKMKIYNTWVQLNYKYKDEKLLYNDSSGMDQSITEFKDYLKKSLT